MNTGDRVELVKNRSGFKPGAQGKVLSADENTAIVAIDTNFRGVAVNPPRILMRCDKSKFRAI